ncbi:hypothetical protein F4802DRAFT_550094 [Xylaria palmicola]|nr:hypothetical protein F4802DRAFT_550094 [Xylaria palmicola]
MGMNKIKEKGKGKEKGMGMGMRMGKGDVRGSREIFVSGGVVLRVVVVYGLWGYPRRAVFIGFCICWTWWHGGTVALVDTKFDFSGY